MSALMWQIAEGDRYYKFVMQQDLRFQAAMREELRNLANDRGLRLVKIDPKKKAQERVERKRKALAELSTPQPNWRIICAEVCAKHDITAAELLSARRPVRLVMARHEAMWRLKNETSMSLPQIGRRLGGRDHTTVISGIKAHERRLANGTAL